MTDNRNNIPLDDALNDCIESMLTNNESLDSCLARHPQHAAELKPLLETMRAAQSARALSPEPAFRARARYEFRRALNDSMSLKERPAFNWRWRWATLVSTAGVFLLTSAGGAVAASSGAMPGQALYSVKRGIENVQLTLTTSQSSKARVYATMASNRVAEIAYAAQNGDVALTEDLTRQFTADLGMVAAIVTPSRALTFGDGSKQSGTPSIDSSSPEYSPATTIGTVGAAGNTTNTLTTTATSAGAAPPVTVSQVPQPTLIVSSPPGVTAAAPVPAPVVTTTQPTYTLSGITDPALLKLLQQYRIKNLAELMAILDKVPPSVRAALLAAIQAATSGYGQILGS